MKNINKNILIFFLMILALILLVLNIHYKKEYNEISIIDDSRVTIQVEEYLSTYLGEMNNSLTTLSAFDDKEIYRDEIENEFLKLISSSSKLSVILEMPKIYAKNNNIFELRGAIIGFNKLLLTSQEGRDYIYTNCNLIAENMGKLTGYAYETDTGIFRESVIKFKQFIESYYQIRKE